MQYVQWNDNDMQRKIKCKICSADTIGKYIKLNLKVKLTTASSWVVVGCWGCPGASTVSSGSQKQKNKKNTTAENNHQRKSKGYTIIIIFIVWFQIATTLRPHDLLEPVHIYLRPLTAKQTTPSWTQMHMKSSISLLLTRLNCIIHFKQNSLKGHIPEASEWYKNNDGFVYTLQLIHFPISA